MDLKDFIKQTVSGIADSVAELQKEYEERGVVINPPVSVNNEKTYLHESERHKYRRIEVIEFDVAVTASSEMAGGGKAGLKVFSAEASLDGRRTSQSEEVSRVKLAIPIVLSPTGIENENRSASRQSEEKDNKSRSASDTESWKTI
jgi:hypothetical protein